MQDSDDSGSTGPGPSRRGGARKRDRYRDRQRDRSGGARQAQQQAQEQQQQQQHARQVVPGAEPALLAPRPHLPSRFFEAPVPGVTAPGPPSSSAADSVHLRCLQRRQESQPGGGCWGRSGGGLQCQAAGQQGPHGALLRGRRRGLRGAGGLVRCGSGPWAPAPARACGGVSPGSPQPRARLLCRRHWPNEPNGWVKGVITDFKGDTNEHTITYGMHTPGQESWEDFDFT